MVSAGKQAGNSPRRQSRAPLRRRGTHLFGAPTCANNNNLPVSQIKLSAASSQSGAAQSSSESRFARRARQRETHKVERRRV